MSETSMDEIRKSLKKELDKSRYEHTMGVMYTAAALAMAHGADQKKAMLAGLLHDCAKCIPNEEKMELCKKYHIELTQAEIDNPALIHAKLGAFLARKKYHVTDEEVLHAILVHTTGEPGMNLLDKIIYIADYIEPGRDKAKNLPVVRPLCFRDLDAALLKILSDTLDYLKSTGKELDPLTEQTCQYYKAKAEEK